MPYVPPTERSAALDRVFRTRALGAVAASLLAVTLAVRLWPAAGAPAPPPLPERPPATELIVLEPVVRTQQPQAPSAAPPPPVSSLAPPVEVPDDVILREIEETPAVSRSQTVIHPDPAPGLPDATPGPPEPPPPVPPPPPEPAPAVVRDPDRAPFPVGPALPVYPEAARREGVRARVRVEVLVDAVGRVQDARIVSRVRLGRGDREEAVPALPHGMDDAALAAARAYRFRPARQGGRAVSSYTTITLSFGV